MDHKKSNKKETKVYKTSSNSENKKKSSFLCCFADNIYDYESQNVDFASKRCGTVSHVDELTSGSAPQTEYIKDEEFKENSICTGFNSELERRCKTKHKLKWILSCFRMNLDDESDVSKKCKSDRIRMSVISLANSPRRGFSKGDYYSESSFAPSGSKGSKFDLIDDPSKLFPRSKSDSQIIDNATSAECEQFSSLNDIEHHKTSVLFNINGKQRVKSSKPQTIQLMATDGSLRTYSTSTLTPVENTAIFDEEKIFKHLNIPFLSDEGSNSASGNELSSGSDNAFIQDEPQFIIDEESEQLHQRNFNSIKKINIPSLNICDIYEPEKEKVLQTAQTPAFIMDKNIFRQAIDFIPIESKVCSGDGNNKEISLNKGPKINKTSLDSESKLKKECSRIIRPDEFLVSISDLQRLGMNIPDDLKYISETEDSIHCYAYETLSESYPYLESDSVQSSIESTEKIKIHLKNINKNEPSPNYGYKKYIIDRYFDSGLPGTLQPVTLESSDAYNNSHQTSELNKFVPKILPEGKFCDKTNYPANYDICALNKELPNKSYGIMNSRTLNQTIISSSKPESNETDLEFSRNPVNEDFFAYPRKLRRSAHFNRADTVKSGTNTVKSGFQRRLRGFSDSDETVIKYYPFIDGPLKSNLGHNFSESVRMKPVGAEKY